MLFRFLETSWIILKMLLEVWVRELYNTNEFTLPSFWTPRWSENLNTHPLFIYKFFIKEYDTFSKTIQGLNIIWTLKVGVWCLDKNYSNLHKNSFDGSSFCLVSRKLTQTILIWFNSHIQIIMCNLEKKCGTQNHICINVSRSINKFY